MPKARRPLSAQTLVITGATSGIGLACARAAAERGVKGLVLAARDEAGLTALADTLRAKGTAVETVRCDVADAGDIGAVVAAADKRFGGFDTWINNAGVSVFGTIEQTPIADQRRLFETNYWGVVNGSLAAVAQFRGREGGGALINVGSVLSDQAIPLQGVYSASKHAVKGFTNALRMELIKDAPEIVVTLIKPSAIATPYNAHAANYTGAPVKNPPPLYSARVVADAILYAAETPVREITVGAGGRALALFGQLVPALAEPVLAWATPWLSKGRARDGELAQAGLHQGAGGLEESGRYLGVRQTSLYTQAQMNPRTTAVALSGVVAAALVRHAVRDWLRVRRIRRETRERYAERHPD